MATAEQSSRSEELERQHYEEICELNKRIETLAQKYLRSKSIAKADKDAYEDAQLELHELIRRGPQATLFDMRSWRAVPIADALDDLSPAILVKLKEAKVFTLGDLADWSNSGNELTDIPGIGQAKAEEIDTCLATFWENNPELGEQYDQDITSTEEESEGDDA